MQLKLIQLILYLVLILKTQAQRFRRYRSFNIGGDTSSDTYLIPEIPVIKDIVNPTSEPTPQPTNRPISVPPTPEPTNRPGPGEPTPEPTARPMDPFIPLSLTVNCGFNHQACCLSNDRITRCNTGLSCRDGICIPCGERNQPCCELQFNSNPCQIGLSCQIIDPISSIAQCRNINRQKPFLE